MKHASKIIAIALILFWPVTANAQPKVLIYTDHEPLGNMRTRFINDVFFPAIEKESGGRLKIEAHWAGELSGSYDALRTVAGGSVADMAIVVPEYSPAELPLHQVFKSFPVGPSGDQQVRFFHQVYAEIPALPAELENANVVNLLFSTGYPVAFFGTKPLESLDDIQGGKWRSASFWHRDFLKNTGAVPVTMPWGEGIYTALQTGALDGLMVNVDSGYELNVHKAAPNVLLSKDLWLGHLYLLAMNRNTWNSLAKQDQEAFQRAAETAYKTLGAVMDSSLDAQVEELRKEGVQVRVLEPEEVERWESSTRYPEIQSAWVKEQEEKGVKNVRSVMEKVTGIMQSTVSEAQHTATH